MGRYLGLACSWWWCGRVYNNYITYVTRTSTLYHSIYVCRYCWRGSRSFDKRCETTLVSVYSPKCPRIVCDYIRQKQMRKYENVKIKKTPKTPTLHTPQPYTLPDTVHGLSKRPVQILWEKLKNPLTRTWRKDDIDDKWSGAMASELRCRRTSLFLCVKELDRWLGLVWESMGGGGGRRWMNE